MSPFVDSIARFSSRVADYVAARPSYPRQVVTLLAEHFDLQHGSSIADIGSGTGILSVVLLEQLKDKDATVIGIEPNKDMRAAAERLLSAYIQQGKFKSKDGTAETTGLDDNSVDIVVAAQAFHWFDVPKTRDEFKRILRRNRGGVALVWNDRRDIAGKADIRKAIDDEASITAKGLTFMAAYDLLLLRRGVDYEKIDHHCVVDENSLNTFFGRGGFHTQTFENPYQLDFDQVKGRMMSSSYAPQKGEVGHDLMIQELRQIFTQYQNGGKVDFVYDTRVFYGGIS